MSLKEGGGFAHKSALIENVLRTLAIKHVLIDLDELSIFCHGTWSPKRFLTKFFSPTFVTLLYAIAQFHTHCTSTV